MATLPRRIRWQDIDWTGDQPEDEFPNADPSAFNAQTALLESQQERFDPNAVPGAPTVYRNFETPGIQTTPVAQEPPPGPPPVAAGAQLAGTPNAFKPIVSQVLGAGLPTFQGETGGIPAQAQAASMAQASAPSGGPSGWDTALGIYSLLNPVAGVAGLAAKNAIPTIKQFPGVGADILESFSKGVGGFGPLDMAAGALRSIAPADDVLVQGRAQIKENETRQQGGLRRDFRSKPLSELMDTSAQPAAPASTWNPPATGGYKPAPGASGGGFAEWKDKSGKLIRKRVDQFGEGPDARHVWTTQYPEGGEGQVDVETGPWLNGQSIDQWKSAELARKSNAAFGDIMNVLGLETAKNQLAQARLAGRSQSRMAELLDQLTPEQQLQLQQTRSLWEKNPEFAVVMQQLQTLDASYKMEKQKIVNGPGSTADKLKAIQDLDKVMKEKREGLQGMVMKRWAPESMMLGGRG